MAETTQELADGTVLTWISWDKVQANYDADEDRGDTESTCATCEYAIGYGDPYWRCIDTGDEIHDDCDFPDW